MKRLMILLLALLLALPALGEEESSALYLLLLQDASGEMQPIGSAVLYGDASTLLTTAPIAKAEGLCAQGAGGTLSITAMKPMENDMTLLTLEQPSPAAPMSLNLETSPAMVLGHDMAGNACTSTLSDMTVMPYGNGYALVYTAQQAMLPGSILVDSSGIFCGAALATYGEGINRYVATTDQALTGLQYGVSWISGFSVTYAQGLLTVDWSACDLSCDQESCVISLFVQDIKNPYFTYYIVKEGTLAELLLPPGRSYQLWLQHAHGEAQPSTTLPENRSFAAEIPSPGTFTLYDYQTAAIYLSTVPAAQSAASDNIYLPPAQNITRETLLDPESAFFLQVRSTYAVQQQESALLAVSLTTPEGYSFHAEGQFLFQPELQQQDDWNVNITDLLDAYLSYCGQLSSGDYTLSYYLDGAIGAQYYFTLE